MAEQLAAAGVGDDLAGRSVTHPTNGARTHRSKTGELGVEHELVVGGRLGRGCSAGGEGARAVGAVAALAARADVDGHEVAALDHRRAGLAVRSRPVGTRRHDRLERQRREAGLADRALDLPRDVGLGAPHERAVGDIGVDDLEDVGGVARGRDLRVALDDAQVFNDPVGEHELDPARGHAAQAISQRVRQCAFEADAGTTGRVLAKALDGKARNVALEHHDVEQRAQVLHPVGVAEVGDEDGAILRQHDDAIRTGVAGQVPHVDEVRDHQRVDTGTAECVDGAIDSSSLLRHS